jgi:hypothetical protein
MEGIAGMRPLLRCLVTAVLMLASSAAPSAAQSLAGYWTGMVGQQRSASLTAYESYPASMRLDGNGQGFIDYPTLGCGGTLTYVWSSGSSIAYRERITRRARLCLDNGTVIVAPRGNALHWSWTGAGYLAEGTLFGQTRELDRNCDACTRIQLHDAEACGRSGNMFAQNRCLQRVSDVWHGCTAACRRAAKSQEIVK